MHGCQGQNLPGWSRVQEHRLLGYGQCTDQVLRNLDEQVFEGVVGVSGEEGWIGDDLEHIHLWS
ncbi:hypothetical protein D3C76_1751290 [compost metagenome]